MCQRPARKKALMRVGPACRSKRAGYASPPRFPRKPRGAVKRAVRSTKVCCRRVFGGAMDGRLCARQTKAGTGTLPRAPEPAATGARGAGC